MVKLAILDPNPEIETLEFDAAHAENMTLVHRIPGAGRVEAPRFIEAPRGKTMFYAEVKDYRKTRGNGRVVRSDSCSEGGGCRSRSA